MLFEGFRVKGEKLEKFKVMLKNFFKNPLNPKVWKVISLIGLVGFIGFLFLRIVTGNEKWMIGGRPGRQIRTS